MIHLATLETLDMDFQKVKSTIESSETFEQLKTANEMFLNFIIKYENLANDQQVFLRQCDLAAVMLYKKNLVKQI